MAQVSALRVAGFLLLFLSVVVAFDMSNDVIEVTDDTRTTYHLNYGEGSCPLQECPNQCARRCSLASRQKRCLFYCNLCCNKCLCVPSGTYGHKEECPCYNNWKTPDGKPKCP
ncbi:hypothetical protein Droror1_Dr00009681 [Drosera rotundifolia]